MSDNFLSFVGRVGKSGTDISPEKSPLAETKSSQGTDFKQIFAKESVPAGVAEEAENTQQPTIPVAPLDAIKATEDITGTEAGSSVAPVLAQIVPDNGNSLPKLSIYAPGLEVGRVILTTSTPKVNADSLAAFARAQGISEAVLSPGLAQGTDLQPQTASAPEPEAVLSPGLAQGTDLQPQTASAPEPTAVSSILSGLLTGLPNAKGSLEKAAETLPRDSKAASGAEDTLAALRAQQAFALAKPEVDPTVTRQSGGDLVNPLASTMIGAHDLRNVHRQPLAESAAKDAGKNFAHREITSDRGQTTEKVAQAKTLSEKLSISEFRQARQAIDSAMELARSNVQNGVEITLTSRDIESPAAAAPALSAPPVNAIQVAPGSAVPVAVSLAAVLSLNDPSLMQARMQPYQDWAEKFGEVLGQKLSLALKQGTWAVKLNLNPHSLGEIAIALEVGEKGVEGQLSSSDGAVRQLLGDALPKLRSSLEELFDQRGSVNIQVDADEDAKGKQSSGDMVEIAIDLEDEIFSSNKVLVGSGITLRDGFDVLV